MGQKFIAREHVTCANGAIAWGSGFMSDCLGLFAKVQNCPIIVDGKEVDRLTCYATGYADTFFSVPACTRKRGRHVRGFFTNADSDDESGRGVVFHVMDSHKHIFSGSDHANPVD